MKCIVPNQNVKIIARAIHSLSKIGEEMFIEPMRDVITFRTVNMAQSAFAEFKMSQSFFSSFSFIEPDDCEASCKVTMRSCINVFKNLHNLDKQIENCEIRLKQDATVVIFQIKFSNATIKKYYLPILESEKLEAIIPSEIQNKVIASSKMLASTIKNFRNTEDEITFNVTEQKIFIKNHIEVKKDLQTMRTELSFHPSEFETYSVTDSACVTFCFKELRAVLLFAEPSNLSVSMSFSTPGRPILFQVSNLPAYEANYVVSTLNANIANQETNLTRRTKVTHSNSQINNNDPYHFIDESQYVIAESNSTIEEHVEQIVNNRIKSNRSSIINEENIINNEINHENNVINSNIKPKGIVLNSTPSLSDGIDSMYSPFDTNTFQKRTSNTSTSLCNKLSTSDTSTTDLIKTVFKRCFNDINFLDGIPGNDIVLAEQSDCESV